MGYWVDMSDPYITYDNKYIESVWYLLKDLYNKNLLYKGYTIQPFSPAAGTGLSSAELNQPGCYKNVKDRTATVQFKIIDFRSKNESVISWLGQQHLGLYLPILRWQLVKTLIMYWLKRLIHLQVPNKL
jgi:isoleucyl-tRNA synthetase